LAGRPTGLALMRREGDPCPSWRSHQQKQVSGNATEIACYELLAGEFVRPISVTGTPGA
jgi:hypothetical protein